MTASTLVELNIIIINTSSFTEHGLYTCLIVSVSRSPVGTSVSDVCEWKKIFMKERWTLLSTVIMQPWALVDEWLGWIKLWIKGKYLAQKHWWAGPNIIPNDFPYPTNKRRSEEHTSELQSPCNLVCRLLLEKKKNTNWLKHPIKHN